MRDDIRAVPAHIRVMRRLLPAIFALVIAGGASADTRPDLLLAVEDHPRLADGDGALVSIVFTDEVRHLDLAIVPRDADGPEALTVPHDWLRNVVVSFSRVRGESRVVSAADLIERTNQHPLAWGGRAASGVYDLPKFEPGEYEVMARLVLPDIAGGGQIVSEVVRMSVRRGDEDVKTRVVYLSALDERLARQKRSDPARRMEVLRELASIAPHDQMAYESLADVSAGRLPDRETLGYITRALEVVEANQAESAAYIPEDARRTTAEWLRKSRAAIAEVQEELRAEGTTVVFERDAKGYRRYLIRRDGKLVRTIE